VGAIDRADERGQQLAVSQCDRGVSILATSSPLEPATIGVDIGVHIARAIASNFRVLPPLRNENKPRSG
jgi:hypothetical protein